VQLRMDRSEAHGRVVMPTQVAVDFWLGPIPPEDMPMIAAQMLADGHDTPATVERILIRDAL
jgi:hypothetical protein